ncbi:MAG TPA: hypothetical protein PK728_11730 [Bacillota bacterium]|nr:hypothetical protein [Bacillota bacterium]
MNILLFIIILLLLIMFLSKGRKDMERFFEKNDLPNGEKVNLYTWSARAILIALVVMILVFVITKEALDAIAWMFIALFIVAWGGPYAQYAIAWNFMTDKKKRK